ncbi:MAG: OFA family MFS transporter [Magnetococcales bacterium]|nr:OFA family MFS transporter [Magnetococcales bacterium]
MSREKVRNRWFVVVGAVLIQLCLGAIYAWSVFTPALIAAGWTKLDTQIVFSVGLATFALVMAFSGKKLPIWRPHRLARISGVTLGLGYFLAGLLGGTGFWPVLIGVGLIGSAGIGVGYVVPIAVGMRWFPDHKGLITGLAVAGFGFGALGWVKIAGDWGHLIESMGLGNTFMIYGVVFILLVLLGSLWMHMPSPQWSPAGYTAPSATAGEGSDNFSIIDMLHTPQFYLIFLTFTVSAGAGLMAIGLMKLYPMEALQAAGYSKIEASAISGTAMAVFFSLANGIGRIVWGIVSDWMGRKRSVILMTLSQGIVFFAFSSMAGNEAMLYLGATLIGFNFGGNFALFPALTADEFGNKTVGQNYPLVFLSYGVGGILFPILGGILGDMDNFPLAFSICGVACIMGAGCSAILFPPHLDEAHRPLSFHGFLHQFHVFDHEKGQEPHH